jgi:hypothetical protein
VPNPGNESDSFPGMRHTVPGTRKVEFPGMRIQSTRNQMLIFPRSSCIFPGTRHHIPGNAVLIPGNAVLIPGNAVLIPGNEIWEYRCSRERGAHIQESDCRSLFEEWVSTTGRRVTLRLHSPLSILVRQRGRRRLLQPTCTHPQTVSPSAMALSRSSPARRGACRSGWSRCRGRLC